METGSGWSPRAEVIWDIPTRFILLFILRLEYSFLKYYHESHEICNKMGDNTALPSCFVVYKGEQEARENG